MVMTHSPKKKPIKLKNYDHFREVILDNFPDLKGKIFKYNHVMLNDIDHLVMLSGFKGMLSVNGQVATLEPLVNYMIDNKHMYEWWKL